MLLPKMSIPEFYRRFPDDSACLAHIMKARFGMAHVCRKCGELSEFAQIQGRRLFRCLRCSQQVSPCVGTIAANSKAPLHDWFYALCVMPDDMTVRQFAAHLGVGFNTALRMKAALRSLGADWRASLDRGLTPQ